jgi:formylglycine-generating enzyme required for sulfatase activity
VRALGLIVIALGVGCTVKPLRFVDLDATTDAESEQDAPADVAQDSAFIDDDVRGASGDGWADALLPDVSPAVGPSCLRNGNPNDCRVVQVARSSAFCVGTNEPMRASDNNTPALCGLNLSAFAIDATEVSVARFAKFRTEWEGGRLPAAQTVRYPNGVVLQVSLPMIGDTSEQAVGIGCNYRFNNPSIRGEHPINCVSRNLAQYFCAWDRGRLPTNAEYEYVVRWWDSANVERTFPWGNEQPSCMYANYSGCTGDDGAETRRVGSTLLGATRGVVFDLGGNVGEWLADDLVNYSALSANPCWTRSSRDPFCAPLAGGVALNRGGGYANLRPTLETVFRGRDMGTPDPVRGFRCVYSL